MPSTAPETYVRRVDDQLVRAIRYTGENLDQLRAWAGPGFTVEGDDPPGVYASLDASERGGVLREGDWVVRDDERVYAVRSYEFRSHCRERSIE